MDIHISIINNDEHRSGMSMADWFFDSKGDLQVKITHMSDWKREVALGLHEMIEALMCKHDEVPLEAVDKFDRPFEEAHDNVTNVGDKADAPYMIQHGFATAAERIWTSYVGICWEDYDQEVGEYGKWARKE